ncbi:MAG: glycosyltransferase family 2 protein [Candidatus Omnitrophica bacterium]|nr:glycosyltransferase family 2 protein [Candidatus Omnitrophota bacterium]
MIHNKKMVVVMPAYNAERTLKKTFDGLPHEFIDEIILVDDGSIDKTILVSRSIGITTYAHDRNKGYGANQKTCYRRALETGADVIVMIHPDYQYDPRLVTAMGSLVAQGIYDVVLASRILGAGALKGGMPFYKYVSNRVLTFIENIVIGQKVSEYHTGYRAFSRDVLTRLPLGEDSDDFVFDNEMLLQAFYFGFKVGEISCPTRYNEESSSINFARSVVYGLGVLGASAGYFFAKRKIRKVPLFDPDGKRL